MAAVLEFLLVDQMEFEMVGLKVVMKETLKVVLMDTIMVVS